MTIELAMRPSQSSERRGRVEEKYSDRLKFLWEQYNKLTGIGLVAAAATLAFLLQGIIFNKDVRDIAVAAHISLDKNWIIISIIGSGMSAILFIVARWCSQIIMERQVYGNFVEATLYFQTILDDETIWPTALKEKPYTAFVSRKRLLKFVSNANEVAGWLGLILLVGSWCAAFIFAWPLLDPLTKH